MGNGAGLDSGSGAGLDSGTDAGQGLGTDDVDSETAGAGLGSVGEMGWESGDARGSENACVGG